MIPALIEKEKQLKEEMKTESLRVLAFRTDGRLAFFFLRNKRLMCFDIEDEAGPAVGDICLARVSNTLPDIGAAYLDAGYKDKVFLDIKNRKNIILADREYDGKLRPGDVLAVKVRALPKAGKKARVIPAPEIEKDSYIHKNAPCMLRSGRKALEKSISNVLEENDARWYTEDQTLYEEAVKLAGGKNDRILLYDDERISLKTLFDLRNAVKRVLSRKVNLPCGGELVFDETEAMNVVDVNSASFVNDKGDPEASLLKLNKEAATETAYQILCRGISGIILIDFVNMKDAESETILLAFLQEELDRLGTRAVAEDITKLGIAEVSRPRSGRKFSEFRTFLDSNILI